MTSETEISPSIDNAPRPKRAYRRLVRIIGLVLTLAAVAYAGHVAGRDQLVLACLLGMTPILLVLGIRRLVRMRREIGAHPTDQESAAPVAAKSRRPVATILAIIVTAVVSVICVGSSVFYLTFSRDLASPPGGPPVIILPISVSADYTGIGRITADGVELDEEIVVAGSSFDEIRQDVLARLKRMKAAELDRVYRYCTDDSREQIPASWRIPPTVHVSPGATTPLTPDDQYALLIENADECFGEDSLATGSWKASRRLGQGVIFHRDRSVSLPAGTVYSGATVLLDLGSFQLLPPLGTDGNTVRYDLELASSSTLILTAPKGSIADVHPATDVASAAGGDDSAQFTLGRRSDRVDLVVLADPFRNQFGKAIYEALLWGPLDWVVGFIGLLASWFLSDVGLSLIKRSVRPLGRLFTGRRRPNAAV